jgi:hypothetical protein
VSGRTSCIQHQPKNPLVILHKDYLDICDGDIAAAVILSILEYWMNYKIDHSDQLKTENANRKRAGLEVLDDDLWIYKSGEEFQKDSLGLLKEHDVARGLKVLLAKGFISRRNNPKFKWDRKWQYQVCIHSVNEALSIPYPCGMHDEQVSNQSVTGTEAIPEITTEETKELKDLKDSGAGAPPPQPADEKPNTPPIEEEEEPQTDLTLTATPGGRILHGLLERENKARKRGTAKSFPSLACQQKWMTQCEGRLNGTLESAVKRALEKGILRVSEIVDFVAKYELNGNSGARSYPPPAASQPQEGFKEAYRRKHPKGATNGNGR